MSKGKKLFLLVSTVLLVIALVIALAMFLYAKSLEHEYASDRFSKSGRFAQISVFIPEASGYTVDKIMYFRYNLEKKLTEKAIVPEKDGARLYVDAFSAFEDNVYFVEETGRTTNAKTAYIGGDFKYFHKEFDGFADISNDVNHDRILLSRTAAWQLYGGEKLYDFPAKSGEQVYYISGVMPDFTKNEYKNYYGNKSAVFADILKDVTRPVTCYEIIITDPVKNFGINTVKECLELEEGTYHLVRNDKRFDALTLIKNIPLLLEVDKQLPEGVVLPAWEMMARKAEKVLSFMMLMFLITVFLPVMCFVFYAYKGIKAVKAVAMKFVIQPVKDRFSYY